MNPIPMVHDYFTQSAAANKGGFPFKPPCNDPYAAVAAAGKLVGETTVPLATT